jgi:hypothetical protein
MYSGGSVEVMEQADQAAHESEQALDEESQVEMLRFVQRDVR